MIKRGRGQRRNRRNRPSDPYAGMSTLDAWRKWFRDSGAAAYWLKVECIECELDRRCLKTPPCEGAVVDE